MSIEVTPFTGLPADDSHPRRSEALAAFALPDGSVIGARVVLFMLDDGRIGAGFYPVPGHGTVLRWDDGPHAEPRVIQWQAPHCDADACGSPCRHH